MVQPSGLMAGSVDDISALLIHFHDGAAHEPCGMSGATAQYFAVWKKGTVLAGTLGAPSQLLTSEGSAR